MSRLGEFSHKLHTGATSYQIVARRKTFFLISVLLLAISVGSLGIKQLNFGVEFSGGSLFEFKAPTATESQLKKTVAKSVADEVGDDDEIVVQNVSGGQWRIQTPSLDAKSVSEVQDSIAKEVRIQSGDVSQDQIGPSWGLEVSKKAGLGLLIFMIACIVFLWVVFEWKMALAAIIALFHDLVITAGIYSLVGFEVTPATVIGFLTILGYSLYDTVVVFDKVRENTAGILGGNRTTYSRATNLAVNQTLARSINTSVVALLPVVGILVVSTAFINATTLKDLALALFVGMLGGTYSSIFIASPVLAVLKEREPRMISLRRRVEAREAAQSDEGKKGKRSRKAKTSAGAATVGEGKKGSRSRDAEDEEPEAVDDVEDGEGAEEQVDDDRPATGDKAVAKAGNGRVTVKPANTGGGQQQAAKRGSQRPQPKRGGGSSNKKKSKGKKKR